MRRFLKTFSESNNSYCKFVLTNASSFYSTESQPRWSWLVQWMYEFHLHYFLCPLWRFLVVILCYIYLACPILLALLCPPMARLLTLNVPDPWNVIPARPSVRPSMMQFKASVTVPDCTGPERYAPYCIVLLHILLWLFDNVKAHFISSLLFLSLCHSFSIFLCYSFIYLKKKVFVVFFFSYPLTFQFSFSFYTIFPHPLFLNFSFLFLFLPSYPFFLSLSSSNFSQ